ncbi:hypothetical protein ULMS_17800 [Patiriisocius marinistellae]|uniref:DUF3822 family protein n=1 Tax=Patiriisocius marinistellae TaxID=2494560 RepID=A0A5J4FYG4_9FLAO|nr:DUF3822 family protein [Patiriisocius marinistellae]GEQ86272.1 hypothetical protein ULMS_17800 [Patiriisocius marinistellae]
MTQLKTNDILKHNNRLSVQISLTGHSFLVTSIVTNAVVFFSEILHKSPISPEEALHKIKDLIDNNLNVTENITEVNLIFNNNISTVVPTPLFDETKAVEYLKFNSKILITDFIANDSLQAHDIVVVYVPYVNISNYFFETYGSFEYHHTTTLLLKHVLGSETFSADLNVHIDVYQNIFTMIITKNGKLILCNTFDYRTPEDFIYYILFCFEQNAINPEETPLFLSGYISEEDATYKLLYNYVRTINFTDLKTKTIFIDGQPAHRHLLLKSFN